MSLYRFDRSILQIDEASMTPEKSGNRRIVRCKVYNKVGRSWGDGI